MALVLGSHVRVSYARTSSIAKKGVFKDREKESVALIYTARRDGASEIALPNRRRCMGHFASKSVMEPAMASSCPLLELSHDMLGVVAHELCDPLQPLLVVNLSSTAKGLRVPMLVELAELKQQRQEAEMLLATTFMNAQAAAALRNPFKSLAELRDTQRLCYSSSSLTNLAHWKTLGTLISCKSLRLLFSLFATNVDLSEGVALLAAGLRQGCLPSLNRLALNYANIGNQGACTLAPALTKRALPSLQFLDLCGNQIGDVGLAALAPGLRRLPPFLCINLSKNQIGDQGLIGALPSFQTLDLLKLGSNQISDTGCAALASAIRSQALPYLNRFDLEGNPASRQAQAAAMAVLGTTRYDECEMMSDERWHKRW